MDRTVRPGDDFFGYVNGTWAKRTEIPADRSSYGVLVAAFANSDKRVADIIADQLQKPSSRMASLYRAYLDEAGVEAKGLSFISASERLRSLQFWRAATPAPLLTSAAGSSSDTSAPHRRSAFAN